MRRRILLLAIGLTALVVLCSAIPLAFLIRSAVGQRADDDTVNQARAISLDLRSVSRSTEQLREYVIAQRRTSGRPVSVTLPDGRTIGSTPDEGNELRPAPSGDGAAPTYPGDGPRTNRGGAPPATLHKVAGGQVAVAVADNASGSYLVRVYLSDDERFAGARNWYLLLLGGSIALLLIGTAAGELLTRRIARPLVRTAETAQLLSIGDTSARAPVDGPREVADVGKALNRLADRIDELIAEERETVADLSHRLRTPLTTLRLDAEALRDRGESERVASHVNELERMLTAVIHAARRPQREGRMPSCDATAIVRERVTFWSALTDEQNRTSTIELPAGPLPVRAAGEDLAAALDALLENVVAHTPEGTAFSVRLAPDGQGAIVVISDDGPGIPDESEIRGRSDRGSTGLGLDIARRCAAAGGGAMSIGRSPSGGAVVTLHLHAP
jgi:signal transduction histidine kinase